MVQLNSSVIPPSTWKPPPTWSIWLYSTATPDWVWPLPLPQPFA